MRDKSNKPNKLNKYDSFLNTLDNLHKNKILHHENNLKKTEIDKLIQQIEFNYDINVSASVNPNVNLTVNPNVNLTVNPNVKKILIKNKTPMIDTQSLNSNKNDIIKVYIDKEINNIDDILFLINEYKLYENIEYNINMRMLHNIKEPLYELNNMVGMNDLKCNVVDQILFFIQNLHKSSNGCDFMHTVIYGPPGTGKTEIAKIIGKIYSKLGILNKGTFKKVTRSDLIAGYLGQTALKTKDAIKDALGGVLFIDEAYALGNTEKKDIFSKECIDTLCEALSDYKENLMVIIAGYEKELHESFFNYNPGLQSRFVWRFKTDEYTGEDLYKIFIKKVEQQEWKCNENITPKWFQNNQKNFKYYGRDIETLLTKVKIVHSKRVFGKKNSEKKIITIEDLDKGVQLYLNNKNTNDNNQNEYIKNHILNTMYC